jgi:hypothetical protein
VRAIAFGLVAAFVPPIVMAQTPIGDPLVEMSISPEVVNVGEVATLTVTVLGPTWFPQPPVFPSFEVPNAAVSLPPDSSRPLSRRVGGETWSGITRRHQVLPLMGARFRLGGGEMSITVADPGHAPRVFQVRVPEVSLQAIVPAGAQALDPYVAGRRLTLSRQVTRPEKDLQAGDAVVITYDATLDGLPALFLPPLAPAIDLPGLAVHRDSPVTDDGPPATRRERVTLVFERGGSFTVPEVQLDWWNTTEAAVESATADAVHLDVRGPAGPAGSAGPRTVRQPRGIMPALVVSAAFLLVLRVVALASRGVRAGLARWYASEPYRFRQLRHALASGELRVAERCLFQWLDIVAPGSSSDTFAAAFGDTALARGLEALSRFRHGAAGGELPADLPRALARARRRWQREGGAARYQPLPPLNP